MKRTTSTTKVTNNHTFKELTLALAILLMIALNCIKVDAREASKPTPIPTESTTQAPKKAPKPENVSEPSDELTAETSEEPTWTIWDEDRNPEISFVDKLAPKKHFLNNDCSVPILMDYSGNWLDQNGVKMSITEANSYFKKYPDYCVAAVKINRKYTDLQTDSRDYRISELEKDIIGATEEVKGNYDFIKEQIDKFYMDKTYLLMAMRPYDTETVEAYMEWMEFTPELIPIHKSNNDWIDQFGNTMTETEAEKIFRKYPDYKKALDRLLKFAKKADIAEDSLFTESQHTYNRWFMWQAREENGITNSMFYNFSSSESTKPHVSWSMEYLANDYDHSADIYRYLISDDYEEAAIKQLKKSPEWCDCCYDLYLNGTRNECEPDRNEPDEIRCEAGHSYQMFRMNLRNKMEELAEAAK